METIYKFEKLNSYPHMKPRDIEIWERFLEKYPGLYSSCQYDFHVGDPPPFNPLMDNDEDWNQDALYRLKIDAVGHNTDRIDIIEVKPDAGPSAIGQVMGYRVLYTRDENPKTEVGMAIVTDKERPNMAYLCKLSGISLFVV